MKLSEQILKRGPLISKEDLDRAQNSQRTGEYVKFLDICERLDSKVDLSNEYCNNYKDVFDLIEKYNIDISDIIPKHKYEKYKEYMINDPIQIAPSIGKELDKVYDLSNADDYKEYVRKLRGEN